MEDSSENTGSGSELDVSTNNAAVLSEENSPIKEKDLAGNIETENKAEERNDVEQKSFTIAECGSDQSVTEAQEPKNCNSPQTATLAEPSSEEDGDKKEIGEVSEHVSEDPITESTKTTLAQLKSFALQTEFHNTLIQNQEWLMFLVYCLGDKSNFIVSEALAILHLLSQKVENRLALCKTLHIFDALTQVVENKSMSEEIVSFAALIFDVLKRALAMPEPAKADKAVKNKPPRRGKDDDANRKAKANRSMASRSKPVYLYIPYNIFFKDKRNNITQTLQQDKDVLSITFDMNKCLCVLRVKLCASSESFGKAVANLGYECYLVAQNEKNEEIKIEMKADSKIGNDIYEYLSESDEDKDKSIEEKALATAEDIKRAEKKGKGWFASAATFVQKSFYW